MDKICVTDTALREVYAVLQDFKETSGAITTECLSALSAELDGLDSNFRNDIQRYMENIALLKEKMNYCIDENSAAINDRVNKIPIYENQTYKKRNII